LFPANKSADIYLADGAGFSYSGRGSGAGVALMSTMGPAGIAVGVAIDEGIRKDLEASAISAGFDIVKLLQSSSISAQSIEILDYGMKDIPGTDDLMFPYLKMRVVSRGVETVAELDFNIFTDDHSVFYSLSSYREDGALIIRSFQKLISRFDQTIDNSRIQIRSASPV
jgi:hypothetical protein